jgi:hypothetical protein
MLTRVIFIIIFVLTISVTAFPTGADQPSITHDSIAEQKTQKANDEEKNPDTINHTTAPALQESRDRGSDEDDDQKNSSWWDFTLTDGLLTLFTLGLWISSTLLWKESREHSRQMKVSLTSTRRAFVFLKHITAKPVMIRQGFDGYKEGQKWMFSPCWVNAGDTPTKNLTISIGSAVFPDEIPTDHPLRYDNVKDIPMVIGPKGAAVVGAFAIPYDTIKPLQDSQSDNLYIWGKARYDDIFGKAHRTRFCVKMLFLTQQIVGEHNIPTFIYYDRYNCSDKDCVD